MTEQQNPAMGGSEARFGGVRALLLLNGVLLMLLMVVTFGAAAGAQDEGVGPRSDYTMVAGRVPGFGGAGAVYVVDTTNQEMVIIGYNRSQQQLQGIGYRNLGRDAAGLARGQQPSR